MGGPDTGAGMITLDQVSESISFLSSTDEQYGTLKAGFMAQKELLRCTYSLSFLETEKGSVEHRKAVSYASQRYIQAVSDYKDACADYEILRARRLSAELTVETWRSISSARNHGQII